MSGPATPKIMKAATWPRTLRVLGQVVLGAVLLVAGIGHLTNQREEFQAQVPSWFPVDADVVVLASGVIELALGAVLLATWKQPKRALVGGAVAAFFVAVFPGNIGQFTGQVDAFGLDTDTKRAVRLVFQPVLVAWALVATDAIHVYKDRRARHI
ncbi:MAG: MauE/DoxX family redox-associated membrane protein [Aquihabitans sp.]